MTASWIGTGVVAIIAAWLALLGVAVLGTLAFSNQDVLGFGAFSLYLLALILVPAVVARRSMRRRSSVRTTAYRTATAVFLVHLPVIPVIIAAIAM